MCLFSGQSLPTDQSLESTAPAQREVVLERTSGALTVSCEYTQHPLAQQDVCVSVSFVL